MGKSITARTALAAIDARKPDMSSTEKHLLLFFAQGHHLGNFGEPLFDEVLYATEHGVELADTDSPLVELGSSRPLNTIDIMMARYSALSPADLRTLIQASTPWQLAMKSTGSQRIERAWLRDWFTRPDEVDDPAGDRFTRSDAAHAAAFLRARRTA